MEFGKRTRVESVPNRRSSRPAVSVGIYDDVLAESKVDSIPLVITVGQV